MKAHSVNSEKSFIQGWTFDNLSICDKLINLHKSSNLKHKGIYGQGKVNTKVKDSTDLGLSSGDEFNEYNTELQTVLDEYITVYPWCNAYAHFGILETVNIQHYKPGGAFHAWHTERAGGTHPGSTRHLAFMTYLNDVSDAGETEFLHQELKVKPEKGLTLIWPCDWTYTHRGVPSPTEDKYIITGWFSFTNIRR